MRNTRRGRRRFRHVPEQLTGCLMLLLLPLLLILAIPVLLVLTWQERWRPCPLCGQRGTLEAVGLLRPTADGDAGNEAGDWSELMIGRRQRVSPERAVLCCSACGLHIRRVDLERLKGEQLETGLPA